MTAGSRSKLIRNLRIVFWLGLLILLFAGWGFIIHMPGKSFHGIPPPLSPDEKLLRAELAGHVQKLGGEIGERNLAHYPQLQTAAEYIESQLGGWKLRRDSYELQGKSCHNIEAELPGASAAVVLIGAHYDSVFGSPGANDNGSGIAALLASRIAFLPSLTRKPSGWLLSLMKNPATSRPARWGATSMPAAAGNAATGSTP